MRVYSASAVALIVILGFVLSRWPMINDITTSMPAPEFMGEAKDSSHYDESFYDIQSEHYPGLTSVVVASGPAQVYDSVRSIMLECFGWDLVFESKPEQIEAVATTSLLRFKDDILVKISYDQNGSKIDVRSKSRVGKSDFGANAARVRGLLKWIELGGCEQGQ